MRFLRHIPIVDTNILVSFFTEDNNFLKAKEIIARYGVYINDYILCETLNFIQKDLSTFHSAVTYDEIRYKGQNVYTFLEITEEQRDRACTILNKFLDNDYSFTDSLILAQAEEYRVKVYTSDFKMANYKNVEVIHPF